MNGIIGRVTHMEKCMERVEEALRCGNVQPVRRQLSTLQTYMSSGQWLRDYEADERGELPEGLKRGVLSQDALYDLLSHAASKQMK